MRDQPLPPKCNLTTNEGHAYVGSRPLFEHLVARCGLNPLWDGKGHKTVLYRVGHINTALDILEANGGWDDTLQQPLHP